MRVLLTGASGYLGLHVLESLVAAGHAVTAVTRRPAMLGPWIDHPSIAVLEADLRDDDSVGRMAPRSPLRANIAEIPVPRFQRRDSIAESSWRILVSRSKATTRFVARSTDHYVRSAHSRAASSSCKRVLSSRASSREFRPFLAAN